MGQPEEKVWNGLFWMIQLFICVNAVAKSFLQESQGRMLYFLYCCRRPRFYSFQIVVQCRANDTHEHRKPVVISIADGQPVAKSFRFIGFVCLGGCSLSLVFTFLAAIAASAARVRR